MSPESTLVSHQYGGGRGFARVAIIDDDALDRRHCRRVLNQISVKLTAIDEASTWDEAVDLLIRNEHDVYLVDYSMGNHTGLELINYLVNHHQNQVFILLTGQDNLDVEIAAAKAGVADYLLKDDLTPRRLERSMRYAWTMNERKRELSKQKADLHAAKELSESEARRNLALAQNLTQAQVELNAALARAEESERDHRHLAQHDPLTGLVNRARFYEELAARLEQAKRKGNHLAVLLLDLDRFKSVNDSYGHRVGDELLQEVGRRLQGCLSRTDTIARMGGDEFAIIATHLKQVDVVTTVAAEIISEISKPFSLKSRRIQTSASVGVALYNRDDRKPPEELVHMADMALYKAKEVRRGSFRYFDKALHDEERRRLFLKREMEDMVLEQEFHLVFQPKIDGQTGEMVGCEALLRWQNPKTGYVAPSEFIPIAEASGHILPISEWVIDAACKELKRWSETGLRDVSIAVNIAPIMLQSTNLFEMIRAKLEKYDLAPGLLEIEITETSAFINLEQAVEQLQSLRDLGVRIAIDDFGTGYSSLDIATTLPADMLKLDGRFVRGATERRSDAAAAIATITLAHCLGMLVVGECVETEEQREFLARNECDQLQGYLFAKPMSADALMAWYQDDERRRSKAA